MHPSSLFQVQFYLQLLIQMYNIKSIFVVTKLTAQTCNGTLTALCKLFIYCILHVNNKFKINSSNCTNVKKNKNFVPIFFVNYKLIGYYNANFIFKVNS